MPGDLFGGPSLDAQRMNHNRKALRGAHSRLPALAVFVLSLVCVFWLVLSSACVSQTTVTGCTASGGFCSGLDLANTRIEIATQRGLRLANTLWVTSKTDSSGVSLDQLSIRWDSYILHINQNGSTCNQEFCRPTATCGAVFAISNSVTDPAVQACEGFGQCANPTAVPTTGGGFDFSASIFGGCTSAATPPLFTATTNTTYQVLLPPIAQKKSILTEKKIFVVTGAPQLATYQTSLYTEAQNPSYAWYTTWQSANNDATKGDNFSANLQVTRVRVLRGMPKTDPVTGMVTLDNSTPVRPSSIILVPNFDPGRSSVLRQNRTRCYADNNPTAHPDGNIDLTNCFTGLNSTGTPPAGGATPTYLKSQPGDTLNWFAEFNPNESQTAPATPPGLGPNEVIVLEFTIAQS